MPHSQFQITSIDQLLRSFYLYLYLQLKTLRIILKNLADPLKASDPKYRSVKLIKISAKFAPCPSAMEYLKAIGFTAIQQDGEDILKIDNVDRGNMEAVMCELQNALEMITPSNERLYEEKKVEYERGTTLMSTSTASFQGKMSEKQKARILLEKKEREERDEAKRARKKTKEQIAQGECCPGATETTIFYQLRSMKSSCNN